MLEPINLLSVLRWSVNTRPERMTLHGACRHSPHRVEQAGLAVTRYPSSQSHEELSLAMTNVALYIE